MKVKIKPILQIVGHEELVVIPISIYGKYVLGLNFYEDIDGGRLARLVLVMDKYGEITGISVIEGDKGVVSAFGVKETFLELSKAIKIERKLETSRLPFFVNIKKKNEPETEDRGITGYKNYMMLNPNVDFSKIKDIVKLEVEELVQS
ncbi:hypothetical protein [Acidianus sp. RZ1]|uniref:hypothetical protein n=1 Tax=Acidianus sp. RZ1 TaxID=1540082 RepID=UPI001490E953|nr:hypothetical protein [Acidianus sp. RZ1]NON61243.1 hypothetical protein [Acidianus sp. RZ1]